MSKKAKSRAGKVQRVNGNIGPRTHITPDELVERFKGELSDLEAKALPGLHESYALFEKSAHGLEDTVLARAFYESNAYLRRTAQQRNASMGDHNRKVGCLVIAITTLEEALRRWSN